MTISQRIENEEDILAEISRGSSEAFRTLYFHYYDRLFQFALYYLNSKPNSEDVVEDLFFNIWKNKQNLVNIPNFQAYVYQGVRNGCLNLLKSGYMSKRGDMPDYVLEINVQTYSPDEILVAKELNIALEKAINTLPERCRIIFKMFKEEAMSQQAIADALNIQICTVQRQILIAKDKIKQAIIPFLSILFGIFFQFLFL